MIDHDPAPPAGPAGVLAGLRREADAGRPCADTLPAARKKEEPIEIDARIVAEALGIAPAEVEPARQAGTITTLCERGIGEDAGLLRATFYLGKRRVRLLVDANGTVLRQDPAPDHPKT